MASRQEIIKHLDISGLLNELLPNAKHTGTNKLLARCPWSERHRNGDSSPSFIAFPADGGYKCQACGEKGSIFDLYGKVHGLDFKGAIKELTKLAGLEPSKVNRIVTGHYAYHDINGELLYWKERFEPGKDGRAKDFLFFNGKGVEPGEAFYLPYAKRKNFEGRGSDPLLYRLPEILVSANIIIVEGEKQADLLHDWGLTTTSLDSGAQSKLTPAMIEQLAGKHVVIMPDNDLPGLQYATRIAAAVLAKAASVKVVELPGLPDKGDIVDWAGLPGNGNLRLQELIGSTGEWEPDEEPEDLHQAEIKVTQESTCNQELRSFPKLYIDMARLFNDTRRYHFRQGLAPLYDSLVLRIANSPGARFPNLPHAVARVLETDEETATSIIDTALEHGLLILEGKSLTSPMITEQYRKAVEKCMIYAQNGAVGGKAPRSKTLKTKNKK